MNRQPRGLRRAVTLVLALVSAAVAAGAAGPGAAQDPGSLYQATAIVTGSDRRSRPAGFAYCLRAVLVKVSGNPRLADDPRVARFAAEANLFIGSFSYMDQMAGIPYHDDQGTYDRPFNLTVRFVPAMIDKILADLGEQPWLGPRPLIVPVLTVRGFDGASYLLSAESPAGADQRASFAGVARDLAMRVRFPTDAELAAWGLTAGPFPSPHASPAPDGALVAGTLVFDRSAPGWVGTWRMRYHGADYAWGIRGVNFDEACRDIVRGVVRVASGHGAPD